MFVVHVASQRDRDPGAFGDVRFVDAETGELRDVDVTPRLAPAYGAAWDAHADELERSAAATTSATCAPMPSAPFEDIILKTFRQGRFLA